MYILVYIKKCMSLKPNPKEINIILNILKGAQFEFLPRAPFYIDTPLYVTYSTVHIKLVLVKLSGLRLRCPIRIKIRT
jgi:hypothetical protein